MTSDSVLSSERLAEMLAGLEGVTPGPWEVVGNSITDWGREWEASMSMEFIPNGTTEEGINERHEFDAAHIARCDPDTMRAILTELISRRSLDDGVEPLDHTFARVAHKATIRIRPEVSGDAEYWRIRTAIQTELAESSPALDAPASVVQVTEGMVERLENIELAARNLNAYLKWQLSPESPGYAPTFPSAVAHFRGQFEDWVFEPGHSRFEEHQKNRRAALTVSQEKE